MDTWCLNCSTGITTRSSHVRLVLISYSMKTHSDLLLLFWFVTFRYRLKRSWDCAKCIGVRHFGFTICCVDSHDHEKTDNVVYLAAIITRETSCILTFGSLSSITLLHMRVCVERLSNCVIDNSSECPSQPCEKIVRFFPYLA